jgi:hypothetical protein
MLRIANVEEIQRLLLRITRLTQQLQERDAGFVEDVKEWLAEFEKILSNNRLAAAASIAALRATLISAERGVIAPGLVFNGRFTPRKIKEATGVDIIRKAEAVGSNSVNADVARIGEAERLMSQIVSVARKKQLFPPIAAAPNHTEWLKTTWRGLIDDPDLATAAIRVEGMVGFQDVLVLLDRGAAFN